MGRSSRELHKVIVVGLPTTSTTEDLLKLVKPYGNALEAAHAVDAEGKPRGFAFVRFADADAQQAAIAGLDKSDLGGRTLNVRAVEDRSAGAASAAAKGRPCFDFARGKCSRGAACKWAHVKVADATAASRRPDWQKTRPAVGAAPADLFGSIPDDYCRKYQLGKCHRGGACRWRHEIWMPAQDAAAAAAAAARGADAAEDADVGDAGRTSKKARRIGGEDEPPPAAGGEAGERARGPEIGFGAQPPGAAMQATLTAALERKEAAWREAHPEAEGEPVPAEALRRDVAWSAMRRMLERCPREVVGE